MNKVEIKGNDVDLAELARKAGEAAVAKPRATKPQPVKEHKVVKEEK